RLSGGGTDGRQAVPGLLRAVARARATRADLPRLVLAGDHRGHPAFPALERQMRELGLADAVRLVGYVADPDLPALLGGAALFAFPSLYEGFGLPPLEAMACGAPVVATRGGSLAEVLGDAAESVPAGDDAAFADALLRVLGAPAHAEVLRQRGFAQAARFTWEACARATLASYHAVAAGG